MKKQRKALTSRGDQGVERVVGGRVVVVVGAQKATVACSAAIPSPIPQQMKLRKQMDR